jgi:hypothetical protein
VERSPGKLVPEFEARLEACLEALREGRADIDELLRRCPEHADALRPHLIAASKLVRAYGGVRPSGEFAAKSRERFLVASGQRLREAFDTEPSPSFFAAARVKFLMAAQRMKLGERAPSRVRGLPLFGTPFRALASAGAAMVMFLGLSTYTVASADAALPGDWRYPVKLQTERVRLALAFSADAKQDVRIDIAAERVDEIEQLTARGRIIGPGVIDRLRDQTAPIIEDLEKLDTGELARVYAITQKSNTVLDRASAQVAPEAQPALEEVRALVKAGAVQSGEMLVNTGPGAVLTPQVPLATPEPADTPEPTETAPAGPETPEASPTPARRGLDVDPTPAGVDRGVTWIRIAVGRFNTLIPSEADGWRIVGVNSTDGSGPAPMLVRLSNADGTQLITINPRNGDTYWFVAIDGVFDEVQLRITRDGEAFVVDRDLVTRLYGPLTVVPFYILDHIEIAPEPAPAQTPAQ